MKNKLLLLIPILIVFVSTSYATTHTISTSGLTYIPANLTVLTGDTIVINATNAHPTAQVSEATWNANGTTALGSGWGVETSSFTIIAGGSGTLFYVCQNHVGDGMKGQIVIETPTKVNESVNKIGFEIFPNPVINQRVNYSIGSQISENVLITIYNEAGKVIHSETISSNSGTINLDVQSGLYLYVIRSDKAELLASGQIVLIE